MKSLKIQVIGYNLTQKLNTKLNIDYTTFDKPNSLDEYDINIINLQNELIWRNSGVTSESINGFSDFISLKTMIINSKKAVNIIALPQNYNFCWYYYSNEYMYKKQLKDMLLNFTERLLKCFFMVSVQDNIIYENTKTICRDSVFDAAFYFRNIGKPLTLSDKSEKVTTILMNNIVYTTLNLFVSKTNIDDFFSTIGLINKENDLPEWVYNYTFYDDKKQKEIIEENEEKIKVLKKKIDDAKKQIESNLYYKSVLSTTGQSLVDVVFDILQKILDCDLSDFKDEKKEDFLIKKDDITFIGEIKGISSNVKTPNISQIEVRYQEYKDDHMDENVKALLIITPLRTVDIEKRDPVGQHQIDVAVRYGSLIITTDVLLCVFDRYLSNKLSCEKIKRTFSTKTGLLTLNDLE